MSSRGQIVALAFVALAKLAHAEATAIDHGSFASPDHRFAFVLTPAQYGYHVAIKDLHAGTPTVSALGASDPDNNAARPHEVSAPIQFQTNIYRVNWTRDSKTFAVIYHVADGSAVDVFHFDGNAWHQMSVEPSPVFPKCPYVDTTGQYDNGPVIHYHGPSFNETIFDENAGAHTVWISYGVETDTSYRHSRFYLCNFDFDPVTQKLSHVELRQLSIPEFLRLRGRYDYTRSLYPRE
jgi:hypothetical protein